MSLDIRDVFVRRVLRTVGEQKLSKDQILEKYQRLHPPTLSFIGKFIHLEDTLPKQVANALGYLFREEYLKKEITRFTDRPLEKDLELYYQSPKGREVMLKLK